MNNTCIHLIRLARSVAIRFLWPVYPLDPAAGRSCGSDLVNENVVVDGASTAGQSRFAEFHHAGWKKKPRMEKFVYRWHGSAAAWLNLCVNPVTEKPLWCVLLLFNSIEEDPSLKYRTQEEVYYKGKEKRFNFDGINQRWGYFSRWGRECGI